MTESFPLTSVPVLTPQASSSSMGGEDLIKMQEKLTALRSGQQETARPEIKNSFNFDALASMMLPYPGLDGHPRRITPISVTLPIPPPQEKEKILSTSIPESPSKSG